MTNSSDIIVALDYRDIEQVRQFVTRLSPALCRLKIGNILFTRYGPSLVEELMLKGFDVFLDLKFHDIPQTVAESCRSVAKLGVWMTNLHVASGKQAMQQARQMVDGFERKPLLIGVTVLTSLQQSDLQRIGVNNQSLEMLVLDMARDAKNNGLDGVVCSAQEAAVLRQELGDDFLLVTPGIRWKQEKDDQRRVVSPARARAAGASYLVIGRPITQADDPLMLLEGGLL